MTLEIGNKSIKVEKTVKVFLANGEIETFGPEETGRLILNEDHVIGVQILKD